MVFSNRKKIQVFSFLGIGFSFFIGSLLLINLTRDSSISKTISPELLLANNQVNNQDDSTQTIDNNQELTLLDKNATLENTVNSNIASEITTTDYNKNLQGFLAPTEIESIDTLVTENQPQIEIDNQLNQEKSPGKPYYDRGLVYSIYQKYPEAIATYDRALTLDPQLTLGYYHRGIAKEKLGNVASAIEDFQKAQLLAKEQNDPTALEMAQQKLDYLVK